MDRQKVFLRIIVISVLGFSMVLLAFIQINNTALGSSTNRVWAAGQSINSISNVQPVLKLPAGANAAFAVDAASAPALTRSRSFSPPSFTRDLDTTDIVMDNDIGLRWVAGSSKAAGFYMQQPPDWNGATPVKVTLYFALAGSSAGAVNWRLKLNSYTPNSGDVILNASTRNGDTIVNFADGPSWNRIYSQTFTLLPGDFENNPLWSFFFLRGNGSNGETFTGALYLLDVEMEYESLSPLATQLMPLVHS